MTIRRIGPIEVAVGNHVAQWTGPATSLGRDFTLSGSLREPESGRAVLELVHNTDRRSVVGQSSGVLEWLDAHDDYAELRGWCLFSAFAYTDGPANADSDSGWAPFTLNGTAFGERLRLVVARSGRIRPATITVNAKSILAQPLWNDLDGGNAFEIDPGGDPFEREYDPRTGWNVDATTGRLLRLHEGALT